MSDLKERVRSLAAQYFKEVVEIRRHLHANPELSFEEFKTSAFIASRLKAFNIPFTDGYVKTGIVALIKGKNPDKRTIALRADIDALPIKEENKVPYCSTNPGVMHACGHDVHTSSLIGSAKILNELRNEFEGTVKLIFQPGEEKLPGGASLMIKEGVLEDPRPKSILAQHVFTSMEAGKVGFRSGMYMASTDELYVTVKGKGGHAAMVRAYISPLLITSEILLELNREFMLTPQKDNIPTVLAFGRMIGNGVTNVIPNEVQLEGTFRTMNENWRKEAHIKMKNIAESIAKKWGGTCDFNIATGYPLLTNDAQTTMRAKESAIAYLGAENVEDLDLRMTGEDFSYYTQHIPACFYRLGTANKSKGITSGVHTSTFDIDERALETGMGLMTWIALNELKGN
ncbi:MAG: amidohydrolase [Bacteroidetes bacterium]|nr:amidohydrolase [Bacteroidota bacterium]